MLPERLNYAIARRCVVECPGCYESFGRNEPDRAAFVRSASVFASLGVTALTLSGGDPLLLSQPLEWIAELRAAGMRHVKLDTVGVGLLAPDRTGAPTLHQILSAVDTLAIPLDGWSDSSALRFRHGIATLHSRTVTLLRALDATGKPGQLVVNTVVHAANIDGLARMAPTVLGLNCLGRWNLFQYTPTDQAGRGANELFAVPDAAFAAAAEALRANSGGDSRIAARSIANRLGDYLLVNSDGDAWLPDADGRTIALGSVFGREGEVLATWAEVAHQLRAERASA